MLKVMEVSVGLPNTILGSSENREGANNECDEIHNTERIIENSLIIKSIHK
jgi:hypothetical protein